MSALFDAIDRSPRAAAIGLTHPPLREAYHSENTSVDFEAADVSPCLLRYSFHCREGEPFGAAELIVGLGTQAAERDETLRAVAGVAPSWAIVALDGKSGLKVSLPVPLMTARGGFDAHAVELCLRWFRMLADWWHRDGVALVPNPVAPDRG